MCIYLYIHANTKFIEELNNVYNGFIVIVYVCVMGNRYYFMNAAIVVQLADVQTVDCK